MTHTHAFFAALSCPTPVTWTNNIKGLFTQVDIVSMKAVTSGRLDLGDYNSVKIWAKPIYTQVSRGLMPPPGSGEQPWSTDKVNMFGCWIQQGCPQ